MGLVTEKTYYRWRKEYGGLRLNQAKRLKVLAERWRREYNQRRPYSALSLVPTEWASHGPKSNLVGGFVGGGGWLADRRTVFGTKG